MSAGTQSTHFEGNVMAPTGGQVLVASLVKHGVDTVFMIPGVQLDWAVDALRERSAELRVYVPRHEQTTTYMADGYYRASGKPGVAMVVPGPGVLNAGAGLATAFAANSKVLLLAGQIHSSAIGSGFGLLHEIGDQAGLLAGLTKWNHRVRDGSEIPSAIASAFSRMHTGRPRPVAVEFPHDILECRLSGGMPDESAPLQVEAETVDAVTVARIAGALDDAAFPVLYVGGGVIAARAFHPLRQLAEKLGAPVIMSENARGALSDRHPLAMSTLAGRALFERADLVVVVGSRFMDSISPEPSWTGRGPKFVFINIDAADLTPPREAFIALRADARQALELLSEAVRPRRVLTEERATALKQWAQNQIDAVSPQASYVRALRDALPEDGIFVNELTQVGYLSRVAFQVYGPNTYVGPGYQGTLGYGFPTALGAAVGGGGRRVVSITGDGGFGWNLQELATARKYDLPVTLVVFNDGHFGNVRAIQKRVFGLDEAFGTNLENPDFMTLAKAFRVPGARVDSPDGLNAAVKTSLQETGPVLIEARVGEMPSPWPLLRLQPLPGVKVPDSAPNPLPARAPAGFRRVGQNSR